MAIVGIVAVDERGAIGKGGSIPWHYPADLKFFKRQTMGNACLMGHRTWLSLKRPLKDRLNIVLSREGRLEPQGGLVLLRDKISVLALSEYLRCDLFIIGGSQVYRSFLPEIERWIVTEIPLSIEDADTFMPEDFLKGFRASDSLVLEENLQVKFYEKL